MPGFLCGVSNLSPHAYTHGVLSPTPASINAGTENVEVLEYSSKSEHLSVCVSVCLVYHYVCVCTPESDCMCTHGARVEVRGQLYEVGS